MKPELRRELAKLSFEEKIRKVGELIRLARSVKRLRGRGSLKETKTMEVFVSERRRESTL